MRAVSGWGRAVQLSLVSPPRAGPIQSVHQEVFDPVSGARRGSEVPAACGQSLGLNNGSLCLPHSSLNRPRLRLLRPPTGSGEGGRLFVAFLCVAAEARCRGTRGRSELGGVCSRACHFTVCAKSSGNARAFLAMCVFGALPLCVCVCVVDIVTHMTSHVGARVLNCFSLFLL